MALKKRLRVAFLESNCICLIIKTKHSPRVILNLFQGLFLKFANNYKKIGLLKQRSSNKFRMTTRGRSYQPHEKIL
jgi:hypothetical protein